jgi:hypothetical protein
MYLKSEASQHELSPIQQNKAIIWIGAHPGGIMIYKYPEKEKVVKEFKCRTSRYKKSSLPYQT